MLMIAFPAAHAEEDAYLVAFTEGRYQDAARLGETSSSPDDLAFAARSLLADAMSVPDYAPPEDRIESAERLARHALATDPTHIEARLQLAIALSLKARPLTTRQAMRTGYGEDAKQLAEAVLEDDPSYEYAHGFLAVWHLEVRRRGGAIGAAIMGASVSDARQHYQAAFAVAPEDASIHWQYARALTALNAKKYRAEIDEVLNRALSCGAETTLEHVMQERARMLYGTLQTERRSTSERLAARML